MEKPPHIALLIESSREYGRGLLRGVARWARENGPWSIYFRPLGLEQSPPPWLTGWRGDGILARINDRRMAEAVMATDLPVVDLRSALADLLLPRIGPDNSAVCRLAGEHLLERGFRHFGFCGMARGLNRFLDARCDFFRQFVEDAGYHCSVFRARRRTSRPVAWEQEQEQIATWLAALPKPAGVMTCNDDRGQQVLDACRRAGLNVPDDVAVIGVDNDEHLCSLADPPLTSVDVNPDRIGYEAAALLDRLMAGAESPTETRELAPRGIVTRQSTDVVAIEDLLMAKAVRFTREQACVPVSVQQVARHVAVSRSTLERRFKRTLSRTPKEEILRVRLDRAKDLLTYGDLPLPVIAEKSGFPSLSHFSEVFHRKVGMTPRAYRRISRVAS